MADATKSYRVFDRRDDLPIFIHRELDDLGLTPEAFRVYAHLVRRFNTEVNAAWPSVRSMAETCFRSRFPNAQADTLDRKVQRAIRELESHGLVLVESRFDAHRQVSNSYTLTAREAWTRQNIPNSDGGGGTAPGGWHRTGGVAPHRGGGTAPKGTLSEDTPIEDTPLKDDDDPPRTNGTSSSSSSRNGLDSWDDLIAEFGESQVIHAMRVASNPGKRHDLRYVRGVLMNLAKRGEAPMGGSRSTPTAAPVSAAGANGAEDQPAPMPAAPVNPVWGLVLDQMSSRVPPSVYKMFLAQSDVDCADGQPVVHLGNEYGVAWVPNRLGPELGRLWRDAGGAGELRYEV